MNMFGALRAFVRSVDLGSFSQAAAEQQTKVSTVLRYVKALEAEVGAALFNRSTRRLNLTEAGRELYVRGSRILADLDDALQSTSELNARPQGLLRVTAPGSFGRRHIMPRLDRFLATYPDIRIDLVLEDRIVDLIDAGIDVAVRIGVLSDSSLIAKRLGPQERVPVASRNYLEVRPEIASPQDLVTHECLSFATQAGSAWYCRKTTEPEAEHMAIPVAGRIRINDTDALVQAAQDGLGIGLLPRWAVVDGLRRGELIHLLPDRQWGTSGGPEPAIWGVYPPKKIVSPKVRAFLDFMTVSMVEADAWR